jgi:predicted MFS family arabinose efflux permease
MPAPWRNRSFLLYFLAETVSTFGSSMLFIGINWYVREVSGTNTAVGAVLSLSIASSFLLFPLAGTVADRFPRRSTLLAMTLCRAGLYLLFLLAAVLGRLEVRAIYLLVVLNGMGWAFHTPVSRGFLQEILERGELVNGNAWVEMSLQAGAFLSAGFTGIVLKLLGIRAVLGIAVGTYLLASLLLAGIRYTPLAVKDSGEPFFAQFSRGLRYLGARPRLLWLGLLMQVPFVVVIVSNVVLPGYVENVLGAGAVAFGLADMSYGLAAFCSSLLLSLFASRLPRFPLLIALFSLVLLALGGLYLNRLAALAYLGMFLFGLGNTPLKILLTSTLMEIVDKEQFGRAMALWTGISSLLQVGLSFALGAALDRVSENHGYLALAAVMAAGLAGLAALLPRMRRGSARSSSEAPPPI